LRDARHRCAGYPRWPLHAAALTTAAHCNAMISAL
jgi:hypothetical protein